MRTRVPASYNLPRLKNAENLCGKEVYAVRSRVFLMVALLAVAGIMAAMAYSTGEVYNPAEGAVVSTQNALLAISCHEGVGNLDKACEIKSDGRAHLNVAKGLNQPGEPGEADPVVDDVESEKASDGYGSRRDRYYKVRLIDDEGHAFPSNTGWYDTQKIKSYDIRGFSYTVNGRCINYKFEYETTGNSKEKDKNWRVAEGTLCIPAEHKHEGEPGEGAPGLYGFQPGSIYTFDNLMKVTNNSNETIKVGHLLQGGLFNEGDGEHSGITTDVSFDTDILGPGETALVSFKFIVPDDWGEPDKFEDRDARYTFNGTVVITGEAIAP